MKRFVVCGMAFVILFITSCAERVVVRDHPRPVVRERTVIKVR